jgi:hypothetical protein
MWPSSLSRAKSREKEEAMTTSTIFIRFTQLAVVTVFAGGAVMGYGGEYDAFAAEQALGPDLRDVRRAFRHATAIYHDTDRLERNG